MAANVTDKITDVRNAARPNSARVSSGRSSGGTTLACDNLVGWPTASKVHFVTYQIDSNSVPVAGTQLDCTGIVSGNNIGSFTVVDGTDTGNAVNDVVEMLPTAGYGQDLADALTSQHSRTGTHTAITATSLTATGALSGTAITGTGVATLNSVVTDTIGSAASHLALSAGASKLVKTTVLRQDDTSNSYKVGNTVILTGWGWKLGSGTGNMSEAVTFGITFTAAPVVVVGSLGVSSGADPTTIGSFGTIDGSYAQGFSVTTTGFTVGILHRDAASNLSNTDRFGYSWTAIGEI